MAARSSTAASPPERPAAGSGNQASSKPERLAAGVAAASPRVAWQALWGWRMIAGVWLPILVIGWLHYGTGAEHHWAHNVLRRCYYLPIIFAAFGLGLRGGLLAAVVVSLTYLPHAFLAIEHLAHTDPASTLEKALEILLYHVVGAVAGYLADSERRRRAQLGKALSEQQRLQRQLVRAGRLSALGEVVAGIAHEIKNPLHALSGTAEIVDPLISKELPERRMWEIHRSEIKRLERVADRFLTFASPVPSEMTRLDLRAVAERLSELVAADCRKKDITLRTELPGEPVWVIGDRDQLAQIGLNIVLNAIRAIGEASGLIRLSVAEGLELHGRTMPALRIENDGPPIPEDDLEHLFDPFHTVGDAGGSGLGLSISARIAEQHDGFIEVANAGLGVVFTLYLPPASS